MRTSGKSAWAMCGLLLAATLNLHSQAPSNMNPPDLRLLLEFAEERPYRRGEMLPLRITPTAATAGTYRWVSEARKLEGGHGIEMDCEPRAHLIEREQESGRLGLHSFLTAYRMRCPGGPGVGEGRGGGIGHPWERSLGEMPLSFQVDVNVRFAFTRAGHYTCVARAASIAAEGDTREPRHAIALVSEPLSFQIIEDPAWAAQELAAILQEMQEKGCDPSGRDDRPEGCFQLALRLQYLDTPESVGAAIRLYAGEYGNWRHALRSAFLETRHRKLALELLSKRILAPDFAVSEQMVNNVAAMQVRERVPEAFAAELEPERLLPYADEAVEALRTHTRRLGASLAKKNAAALEASRRAYVRWAETSLCGEPLVPATEMELHLPSSSPNPGKDDLE